ncbi:MAG: hypothetical protein HFE75_13535 [Firmicutes bacterium]|jgi:hypothetical protein|nr:hypothetical protein [Bacillota bacterium]
MTAGRLRDLANMAGDQKRGRRKLGCPTQWHWAEGLRNLFEKFRIQEAGVPYEHD